MKETILDEASESFTEAQRMLKLKYTNKQVFTKWPQRPMSTLRKLDGKCRALTVLQFLRNFVNCDRSEVDE